MKSFVSECNVGFDRDYEDKSSYNTSWMRNGSTNYKTPWTFTESSVHNIRTHELISTNRYHLEGYMVQFNATNIHETITELILHNWIDKYTRLLYLELFVYDPSVNLLSPVVIALEFTASGYILVTEMFFNFVLFPGLSPEHEFVQFAELIFFVMTFYFIYDIFKRKHRMSSSWLSGWLITEAIMIILSFVLLILMALKDFYVYKLTERSVQRSFNTDTARKVASYQSKQEHVLAALNIVSIALLMKPVFTLGLFDDMYIAVVKTLMEMRNIALETIVIMIAFTFWARAAFAAQVSTFSTMSKTFPTLMDMLVRPDNDDLYDIPFFGPFLLFVYFIILIILISNIFISAIQQSYSEARRSMEGIERVSVLKYVMKSLNKKSSRRLLKLNLSQKLGRINGIANRSRFKTIVGKRSEDFKVGRRQAMREKRDAENGGSLLENNATKKEAKDFVDAAERSKEEEERSRESTLLDQAVNRLETFANKRIRNEHAEDQILIATISEKWKKIVERKPPMKVISIYRQYIRKPTNERC